MKIFEMLDTVTKLKQDVEDLDACIGLTQQDGSVSEVVNLVQEANAVLDDILKYTDAINQANNKIEITIGETTMTIGQWLIWRREVYPREWQCVTNAIVSLKRSGKAPDEYLYLRQSRLKHLHAQLSMALKKANETEME